MAFACCLLLGVLSVLVLSWVPSSDPWAWIDWGQEIASSKISFGLAGGPSWKPFPAFFTTVFALFGGAAPSMWLIVTRTAALLAIVAAFRLGRRLGGPVAGIAAALALCMSQDWLFYFARGASEPVVAALTLWAVDRHLEGSPRLAYFLVFLAALNRPEFSAVLVLYAVYLWLRVPRSRALAVGLVALVPVAWLVPPWILTGDAFQAAHAAAAGKGSPGSGPAELRAGATVMTPAILVLAAIGLAFAYLRRERELLWLGIGAVTWALLVALITQVSYGLPRYLLPGAAIGCVLAGVAVARLTAGAADHLARARGETTGRPWPAIVVGVLIVAATLPWSIPRLRAHRNEIRDANLAVHLQQRLFSLVDRVGGARTLLPCSSSYVAVNHSVASALAWKLEVQLRRVHPSMRTTGFVFTAPHNRDTGSPPPIVHAGHRIRTVARARPWVVREVTLASGSTPTPCSTAPRA